MRTFLIQNWGSLASVAGLVFSILAFVFSKRASKAAKEARELVLSRSLSQDMNEGGRKASDIVTYVGLGRGDMTLIRVGELLDLVSYFIARWEARLGAESRNRLLTTREQLLSIHGVLTKSQLADLKPADRARLAQTCQRVSVTFSEEYGNAVKAAD